MRKSMRMLRTVTIFLIILIFPLVVLAHGIEPELEAEPGILPGDWKYSFERIGEWFDLNLFTVSTKAKQEKNRSLADERVAELLALAARSDVRQKDLLEGLRRYQFFLREAEDMAEKIIFLDGAEINLAAEMEGTTRTHEQLFAEALEGPRDERSGILREALATAIIANEKIFQFMVEKYQFNEADIRKNRLIVQRHMNIVEARLLSSDKAKEISKLLREAEKFRKAGLNVESYDLVKKAKNIVY